MSMHGLELEKNMFLMKIYGTGSEKNTKALQKVFYPGHLYKKEVMYCLCFKWRKLIKNTVLQFTKVQWIIAM